MIGAGQRVEIWDATAWDTYLAEQEQVFAEQADEVVPGLSTLTAVPGLAGIPLTARGVASQLTVLTGTSGDGRDLDYEQLAATPGTLGQGGDGAFGLGGGGGGGGGGIYGGGGGGADWSCDWSCGWLCARAMPALPAMIASPQAANNSPDAIFLASLCSGRSLHIFSPP